MSINTAVIVAAGKGRRMGTEISKQFLPLCGKEILAHTVEKFEKAACIRDIILVTGGDALQDVRQMAQEYGWKKIISVTEGGKGTAGFCIPWLAAGAAGYGNCADS